MDGGGDPTVRRNRTWSRPRLPWGEADAFPTGHDEGRATSSARTPTADLVGASREESLRYEQAGRHRKPTTSNRRRRQTGLHRRSIGGGGIALAGHASRGSRRLMGIASPPASRVRNWGIQHRQTGTTAGCSFSQGTWAAHGGGEYASSANQATATSRSPSQSECWPVKAAVPGRCVGTGPVGCDPAQRRC